MPRAPFRRLAAPRELRPLRRDGSSGGRAQPARMGGRLGPSIPTSRQPVPVPPCPGRGLRRRCSCQSSPAASSASCTCCHAAASDSSRRILTCRRSSGALGSRPISSATAASRSSARLPGRVTTTTIAVSGTDRAPRTRLWSPALRAWRLRARVLLALLGGPLAERERPFGDLLRNGFELQPTLLLRALALSGHVHVPSL